MNPTRIIRTFSMSLAVAALTVVALSGAAMAHPGHGDPNPAADVPLTANPGPPPPCEVVATRDADGEADSFVACLTVANGDSADLVEHSLASKRTVHPGRLSVILLDEPK